MGGTVNGGRVYGDWPGLAPAQLYQRRDLAVTTDFRTVLAAILERHMRLGDRQGSKRCCRAPRRRRKIWQDNFGMSLSSPRSGRAK